MTINRQQTVAFSGHRTLNFGTDSSQLYQTILSTIEQLHQQGYNTFISGMAVGFDMIAAGAVVELKILYPNIKLIAAIPFMGQELRYNNQDKRLYARILEQCDHAQVIADSFSYKAYFKRNDFMVDNCSTLVCYFNGSSSGTKYTVDRAIANSIHILHLANEVGVVVQKKRHPMDAARSLSRT